MSAPSITAAMSDTTPTPEAQAQAEAKRLQAELNRRQEEAARFRVHDRTQKWTDSRCVAFDGGQAPNCARLTLQECVVCQREAVAVSRPSC